MVDELHLLFAALQVHTVSGLVHAVVHLVAWRHVDLEVGAHGCLDRAIQSLLNLLTNFLVVVACSQLLVEFAVGGGVETLNHCLLSGGCTGTLGFPRGFATEMYS